MTDKLKIILILITKYLRIKDDLKYKINGKINVKLKLMFILKLNW